MSVNIMAQSSAAQCAHIRSAAAGHGGRVAQPIIQGQVCVYHNLASRNVSHPLSR